MNNPRTTIAGILTIVAAVAVAVKSLLLGATVDWATTVSAVMAALVGLGLWAAKDGGS